MKSEEIHRPPKEKNHQGRRALRRQKTSHRHHQTERHRKIDPASRPFSSIYSSNIPIDSVRTIPNARSPRRISTWTIPPRGDQQAVRTSWPHLSLEITFKSAFLSYCHNSFYPLYHETYRSKATNHTTQTRHPLSRSCWTSKSTSTNLVPITPLVFVSSLPHTSDSNPTS